MNTSCQTRCVVPYLNVTVSPNGRVSPCCMSTKQFKTDKNYKYLYEAPLLDFWNSDSRKTMIANLDSGIRIPECNDCWAEEAVGKESKRLRENKKYKDRSLDFASLPVILDLSFGNLCNLKCRICNPYHSSLLMQENSKIEKTVIDDDNLDYITIKKSFDTENKMLWNDLDQFLPNAERLELLGGEPFYIKKNWDIIKKCSDNNWCQNQTLNFSTNGTIFPDNKIETLNRFKEIEIWISVDALDKKFNYIRHPANWEEVYNNIKKFIAIKSTYGDKWKIGVQITISAFNILNLFETFEFLSSLGISIRTNIVHDFRSVQVFPDKVKNRIRESLIHTQSKYNVDLWNESKFEIIKFLNSPSSPRETLIKFIEEIKLRDNLRNESFREVFPELYQLLKDVYE